jgi:hypothetical protein
VIGPSHVVVPVYAAAIRPWVTSEVMAVIVMPQSGVRSSPPAGKASVSVSVVPVIAPETVPAFCLWQEPHVPSVRLAGSRIDVPERAWPVCVKLHVNVSGPCASVPLPFHVPLRFRRAALGDGGGAALGDVGAGDDPQPSAGKSRNVETISRRTLFTDARSIKLSAK